MTSRYCGIGLPDFENLPAIDHPQEVPTYFERISQLSEVLQSLPDELAPSSCPNSPSMDTRVDALRQKFADAITGSVSETRNSKWGHVSNLTKMASTSRQAYFPAVPNVDGQLSYIGAAPKVRVGQTRKAKLDGYQFVMPDTEEEWWECEKKWESWVASGGMERSLKGAQMKTSKYWNKEESEAEPPPLSLEKTRAVREKVQSWRVNIPSIRKTMLSQVSNVPSVDMEQGSSQPKKGELTQDPVRKQPSLMFPVVKHLASDSSAGKPSQDRGDVGPNQHPLVPAASGSPMQVDVPSIDEAVGRQPEEDISPEEVQGHHAPNINDIPETVSCDLTLTSLAWLTRI